MIAASASGGEESTHVNGLRLALGEQLLQKASDPKPLRRSATVTSG